MTVGKDVSTLFTDVINCIQTENLELKKLVYLYLINYAKTQPELALLAVNTFVRDANDPVSRHFSICFLSTSLLSFSLFEKSSYNVLPIDPIQFNFIHIEPLD